MELCHPDSLVSMVMNRFLWKSLNREALCLFQVTSLQDFFSSLQCWYHENRFFVPILDPSPDCLRWD